MPPFRRFSRVARFALSLAVAAVALPALSYAAPPAQQPVRPIVKSDPSVIDPELAEAIKNAPTSAQWPNNDYARLLDIGKVTVTRDGSIVALYRETYKLFNERAREKAEVSLPYNSAYQAVRVVSARTISKEGKVTVVKSEDIRSASPFSDYLMYDDAMAVGFSLPAIENDCVIDYTYEMITRPMLLPGQFWTYWGFSGPEPVSLCRYELTTPADKPLKFKTYNDDSLKPVVATSADGATKTYVWEKRALPPLDIEPSMPPYQEVHSWMEISSLTSWQDIAKWFWELQQPQAYPNDAIRATVKTVTANAKTDEEKARAIYDWVANKTRYVGLEFGISAFRPHPAADVHDKLYGDCKDKATLLITMLGVAGVKASPVLLNVEDRTAVSDRLPGPQAFDHCIAVADVAGKEVWLDATAETCAYGDIPESDRGVQALVIRNGKGEFETIPRYAATENGVEIATNIQARPDGGATVKSEMKWRGGASQQWREGIRSITPDKRKLTMQRMAQSFSVGATVKDFTLPDGADKNGPFVMGLSADAPNWARRTSRLLLLPISNWLNGNERRNPFVQDKRVWPIVSNDSSQTTNTVTISLPEGYILDDTPENVSLSGPFQEYRRVITLAPDGKSVVIKETTVEKAGKVPQGEYAKVRAYYDSLLKSADDFIVLKKAK